MTQKELYSRIGEMQRRLHMLQDAMSGAFYMPGNTLQTATREFRKLVKEHDAAVDEYKRLYGDEQ